MELFIVTLTFFCFLLCSIPNSTYHLICRFHCCLAFSWYFQRTLENAEDSENLFSDWCQNLDSEAHYRVCLGVVIFCKCVTRCLSKLNFICKFFFQLLIIEIPQVFHGQFRTWLSWINLYCQQTLPTHLLLYSVGFGTDACKIPQTLFRYENWPFLQ